VATFAQWRAAIDAGDLRRVTWVAGDQTVLKEEVVDTTRAKVNPSELDYVSFSYGPNFERLVWPEVNQFPLTPGANRLIVIRDADKLTRWEQLGTWLSRTRNLPGVYLIFVSAEADFPSTGTGNKKVLKPHVATLRAPRGYLVRCTMPGPDEAVKWIKTRASLTDDLARHLLTRTGGDLDAAAAVCAKLALFEQAAGAATIDALVTETPAADFTDNLIAGKKRHALLSLYSIGDGDYFRAIALLDSRLDLLNKLNRLQIAGRSWRDTAGINPFLLRQYMPYAKDYDASVCSHRRRVLATIDNVLRDGARDAVMESLVALW
jgi:DNA polymerase III delta subunit